MRINIYARRVLRYALREAITAARQASDGDFRDAADATALSPHYSSPGRTLKIDRLMRYWYGFQSFHREEHLPHAASACLSML
jgi:hypothetical protein